MLDKVLDKIKKTRGVVKFDNTKILIDTDDKLPEYIHCVKCVQMRSFFWSVFSCIRAEYGPQRPPHLDIFHAVITLKNVVILVVCVINEDAQYYLKIFFEEAL